MINEDGENKIIEVNANNNSEAMIKAESENPGWISISAIFDSPSIRNS